MVDTLRHVYLDNASTTQVAPEVLEAMLPYWREVYANPSSPHAWGNQARTAVEQARRTISHLLHAPPGTLFFTSGGTEANNWALQGAVTAHHLKHVITAQVEHMSVLQPLRALEGRGLVRCHYVALDAQGGIRYEDLERLLGRYPGALVSLMHGNNELGNLTDVVRVGSLCRAHGALLHCDMVQTLGHQQIALGQLPVDLASFSAHKLHGPKGIGLLYVRAGVAIAPLLHGGMQERGLRGATEHVAGIIGFAKALALASQGRATQQQTLAKLKGRLVSGLQEAIPGVTFYGQCAAPGQSLPHLVSVGLPQQVDQETLMLQLVLRGIAASSGSACMSGTTARSHVLEALGAAPRAVVRLSMSPYNTEEEMDYVIAQLAALCKQGAAS